MSQRCLSCNSAMDYDTTKTTCKKCAAVPAPRDPGTVVHTPPHELGVTAAGVTDPKAQSKQAARVDALTAAAERETEDVLRAHHNETGRLADKADRLAQGVGDAYGEAKTAREREQSRAPAAKGVGDAHQTSSRAPAPLAGRAPGDEKPNEDPRKG